MSDNAVINGEEYRSQDFISIEHGYKFIELTTFDRHEHTTASIKLVPAEARRLAEELNRRALQVENEAGRQQAPQPH